MPDVESRYAYCHAINAGMSDSEQVVFLRLKCELRDARDLNGYIDRVCVIFHSNNMAHTEVFFNQEVWPCECQVSRFDCGTDTEPVPFRNIHFSAKKWHDIFYEEMYRESILKRELRKSMSLLALAKFLSGSEVDNVISGINAQSCHLPDGRRLTLAIADA